MKLNRLLLAVLLLGFASGAHAQSVPPPNGTAPQIILKWTASVPGSDPVVSYDVLRETGSPTTPAYAVIASGVTAVTYTDTTISANIDYCYVVVGVDANGNTSPYSNQACATFLLPAAPTGVSGTP